MPELTFEGKKFESEFEKNVYLMRKWQKEVSDHGGFDNYRMKEIYEKKVDEHFKNQQSLFKT